MAVTRVPVPMQDCELRTNQVDVPLPQLGEVSHHRHRANLVAGGKRTIDVELLGIRIGDFVLITFPGELTVRIGLNIKGESPHDLTFVAGYTNGYIYYAPTAEQLRNVGGAQEDSDCLLAPAWQSLFENRAAEMLRKL